MIGHADYQSNTTTAILQEACQCTTGLPFVSQKKQPIVFTETQAVSAVRRMFYEEDCCGLLVILATWVECNVVMSALKELRGSPCMLWGFPSEQVNGVIEGTGSYVSATMFAGVVRRLGLPCPLLFSSWKDPETRHKIDAFSRAAAALDALFYSKIGLFGYTSMSIYTGTFDHVLLRYRIGPEVEQMDTYSLIRAAEAATPAEIDAAVARLRQFACLHSEVKNETLHKTMGLYVALREFCQEHNWQAVNVKCQYELSKEYRLVPCVALSLLAEDGITASCEGDMLCTVSMLLLQALSQQTVWYGDSLTHSGNVLQFSPCGFLPFTMANGIANVQNFMEHPGFAGIQVSGVLRPEKVTYLRLVEDIGTYHLIYGTGQGLQTLPRGGCMPALNVKLDGSMDTLLQSYAGQHFAIAYGDLSQEIELFAQLMGIPAYRM